jgi:hypothetical protein
MKEEIKYMSTQQRQRCDVNRVILISGNRGAGKDTVGSRLVEKWGFIQLSFATDLKVDTSKAFSLPLSMMYDRKMKEEPLHELPVIHLDETSRKLQEVFSAELSSGYWTPRALMIAEGAFRRMVEPHYWVLRTARKIWEIFTESGQTNFVITDWRFKSELGALHAFFGFSALGWEIDLWRIDRPGSTYSMDPSERDLDDVQVDRYIENDRTIMDLHNIVDNLMICSVD